MLSSKKECASRHGVGPGDPAGAQVVVAWCLRRAFPDQPLQMVAEEDSADLRWCSMHDVFTVQIVIMRDDMLCSVRSCNM